MPAIDDLVKNAWFQFSGFAVGILGIVIAVATYLFSRRYKRLWYSLRSFTLVDHRRATASRLKIFFDERVVTDLTITKVVIWNSGKEVLRDHDFPPRERLTLRTQSDAEILEASIIQTRAESCNCTMTRVEPNQFEPNFDFLDPRDGFVIQLAHTGTASNDVAVVGRIVGQGRIEKRSAMGPFRILPTILPKAGRRGRVVVALVLAGFALYVMISPWTKPLAAGTAKAGVFDSSMVNRVVLPLLGIVYLWMASAIWRSGPPRGLERFDDESG